MDLKMEPFSELCRVTSLKGTPSKDGVLNIETGKHSYVLFWCTDNLYAKALTNRLSRKTHKQKEIPLDCFIVIKLIIHCPLHVGKRMMMMVWGNGVVGQALSMLLGKQCLLNRWYRTEVSIVNAALDVLMMVRRQDRTGQVLRDSEEKTRDLICNSITTELWGIPPHKKLNGFKSWHWWIPEPGSWGSVWSCGCSWRTVCKRVKSSTTTTMIQ